MSLQRSSHGFGGGFVGRFPAPNHKKRVQSKVNTAKIPFQGDSDGHTASVAHTHASGQAASTCQIVNNQINVVGDVSPRQRPKLWSVTVY